RSKNAIWISMIWSFFPLVPTDLICYIAGIVKMPLRYLLIGVGLGELILVTCYVYLGSGMIEWMMG
ncbi:MAG: putative membrane protein YdjX (TVP38/TMEM64 family), partial [Arenicella sp.]